MKFIKLLVCVFLFTGCAEGLIESGLETNATDRIDLEKETVSQSADGKTSPNPLTCSGTLDEHDPNGIHDMGDEPQFEGWYYRMTNPYTNQSWVFIAAYWVDDEQRTHAFVELIHSESGDVYKQVFEDIDLESIQAKAGTVDLELGDMRITSESIEGRMETEDGEVVTIQLSIDGCARWGAPDDDFNRWTMGWATEFPAIPLKWHVHHLKAFASGEIQTPEGSWEVTDYPMHQEKNWGRAFPTEWYWFQSNHFEGRPDVAFAAASGPVWSHRLAPTGFMAGLRWNDQFFTWRTQDTHSLVMSWFWIDEEAGEARWHLIGDSHRYRVDVEVWAPIDELITIDIPTSNGLIPGAVEHLSADMKISLYEKTILGWHHVDTVYSSAAAVEAGGRAASRNGLLPD